MAATLIYTQPINGPVVSVPLTAGALDIVWTPADTVNGNYFIWDSPNGDILLAWNQGTNPVGSASQIRHIGCLRCDELGWRIDCCQRWADRLLPRQTQSRRAPRSGRSLMVRLWSRPRLKIRQTWRTVLRSIRRWDRARPFQRLWIARPSHRAFTAHQVAP